VRNLVRFLAVAVAAAVTAASPALAQRTPTPPPPNPALHVYRETADGGVQLVVAHDVAASTVAAIRSQLRSAAKAYQRGDYDDPAGMPPSSLAALRSGSARINVFYTNIEDGGAIKFKTTDRALVRALYDLFSAEVAAQRRVHPLGGPGDV